MQSAPRSRQEQGADLHMAQLMPLPHTVSCFSKIQIAFTFLVTAYLGSPGKRAIKRVCVYVCLCWNLKCDCSYLCRKMLPHVSCKCRGHGLWNIRHCDFCNFAGIWMVACWMPFHVHTFSSLIHLMETTCRLAECSETNSCSVCRHLLLYWLLLNQDY